MIAQVAADAQQHVGAVRGLAAHLARDVLLHPSRPQSSWGISQREVSKMHIHSECRRACSCHASDQSHNKGLTAQSVKPAVVRAGAASAASAQSCNELESTSPTSSTMTSLPHSSSSESKQMTGRLSLRRRLRGGLRYMHSRSVISIASTRQEVQGHLLDMEQHDKLGLAAA